MKPISINFTKLFSVKEKLNIIRDWRHGGQIIEFPPLPTIVEDTIPRRQLNFLKHHYMTSDEVYEIGRAYRLRYRLNVYSDT